VGVTGRRIKGRIKHSLRYSLAHLPQPIQEMYVRRKHLRIVAVNMQGLVEPAFLGQPSGNQIQWINPEGKPSLPILGIDLYSFTGEDAVVARQWLTQYPWDSNSELDSRTDNFYDEVGRVKAALRTRLWLQDIDQRPTQGVGGKVLFDARSIQSAVHGHRGIGRFAEAALASVISEVDHSRLVLLVDRGLGPLPERLTGQCELITRVTPDRADQFCGLIEPSPMTDSPDPLVSLLEVDIPKLAIVFDFIPLNYPSIYLKTVAERLEYTTNLDALKLFNEFVCISQVAKDQLIAFFLDSNAATSVVSAAQRALVGWPSLVFESGNLPHFVDRTGPIVVVTGDEPRKNTLGALSAIGAATVGEDPREVVVLGMSKHATLIHHLAMYAAIRPGEVVTSPRLSDAHMTQLLEAASLVVVASFDEGLSLPVIEALRAGTPVVASDIPAHRELIGQGDYLADPRDPADMCRAIRKHRGRARTAGVEYRNLSRHEHKGLESVVALHAKRMLAQGCEVVSKSELNAHSSSSATRLSIGVATPWEPQPTGVADFSAATIRALAEYADLTVYTTSEAIPTAEDLANTRVTFKSVEVLFDQHGEHEHDALLVVLGNSHYHVPFLNLLSVTDCIAIAHDTRMVELYMALRGKGGAEDIMLRTLDGGAPDQISPSLDDQIDDMRLLQNAGMWEVARRSQGLILHSSSAASRIERETGVTPFVLPFANQRVPHLPVITESDRAAAVQHLELDPNKIHLSTFGYVDFRTKMTDIVLEAAGWLTLWGNSVVLHVVGASPDAQHAALVSRAHELGVELHITGFVADTEFRDYLMATDIGIQLRVSPLLGVSGPLSDLAAFGTTSVASNGLAVDVDAPSYVKRLPDWVSPVMVAQEVEKLILSPLTPAEKEADRVTYLAGKDPKLYAEKLLEVIKVVSFPREL
jgi:glycosyltransferase involved in cell wall biosynthesis